MKCPHCHNEINSGATKCPHCTGNIEYQNSSSGVVLAFAAIGAIIIPWLSIKVLGANFHWWQIPLGAVLGAGCTVTAVKGK